MGQATRTYAPPRAGAFPIDIGPSDLSGIRSLEVDNGSSLTLTVIADGQTIRTVIPYTSRFNINTGGAWETVQVASNGAAIQSTDALTIIAYDQPVVPPLLPSYGPTVYGLTVFGRLTASTVGASAQPLLNRVYLGVPLVLTGLSGGGAVAQTPFTVIGLPASAVGAVLQVRFTGQQIGAQLQIGPQGFTGVASIHLETDVAGNDVFDNGTTATSPSATLQMDYIVSGTVMPWSAGIYLIAYDEVA